jgi:hypothetical protein
MFVTVLPAGAGFVPTDGRGLAVKVTEKRLKSLKKPQ